MPNSWTSPATLGCEYETPNLHSPEERYDSFLTSVRVEFPSVWWVFMEKSMVLGEREGVVPGARPKPASSMTPVVRPERKSGTKRYIECTHQALLRTTKAWGKYYSEKILIRRWCPHFDAMQDWSNGEDVWKLLRLCNVECGKTTKRLLT